MNSPVRLGVSPTTTTPTGFYRQVLRPHFPALEPWVAWSVLLPSCSFWFIAHKCGTTWSTSHYPACPVLQPPPCYMSSPPQLPIPTPPTGLDECFLFNSLVVGLPYSLIFWQFWLFFVFKFVVALLLVVKVGKVYLPMLHVG